MSNDFRDKFPPPEMVAAWVVKEAWEIYGIAGDQSEDAPARGIINESAVWRERYRQWKARAPGDTQVARFWYDHFEPVPHYVGLSSFAPDWVEDNGLRLASPRLFALLDQPAGSLQGIPAETEWLGPHVPDWSYLWLAYMPFVPALDLDRCEGERAPIMRGGKQIEVLDRCELLRLRDGFVPPCGLFTPAESTPLLIMASEAVAAAVLHAGCTGIEFRHPEAAFIIGRWFRRSVDGVELHPRDVALLEAQANPAPDTEPDMGLPPLGPPLQWDHSALDLLDWTDADTELTVYMKDADRKDYAFLLTLLLEGYVSSSERLVQQLLAGIADVRAGRVECRTKDLAGEVVVTIRPDAAWVWYEHAYPGKQLRPFPLDAMEVVLRRWAEAIRHYKGEND